MTRWLVILVALGACKGDRPEGAPEGVFDVRIKVEEHGAVYLKLDLALRVRAPRRETATVAVRTVCQIGADRLLSLDPWPANLQPGVTADLESHPFVRHPLPARPTLCEVEVLDAMTRDAVSLGRVCWEQGKIVYKPCPPNVISSATAGATGVTAVVSRVTTTSAHLRIRYRATAHRDVPRGAHLVRMTSCKGHRNDDSWHTELGFLRAGESLALSVAAENIGVPAAGASCETVLGYSPELHGEITDLATFCHRDAVITPGPCSR